MTTKAELQEKLDAANWAIDGYEAERAELERLREQTRVPYRMVRE